MRLVLASSSPRRAELLARLGVEFDVIPSHVDEARHPDEPPPTYVERLAREKADALSGPDSVVLAADTAVVHEGHVLGKPAHPEEARSMLRRLAGDRHDVFTGVAVAANGALAALVDVTEVTIVPMTTDEISDYVNSGEPMGKAGAYALQGRGGIYVEAVSGSPFTVMGLPLHLLHRLARKVGAELDQFVPPSDLWTQ
jgi:septum formation protein